MSNETKSSSLGALVSVNQERLGALVQSGFQKAVVSQYPLAAQNVTRLRKANPEKTPAELIQYINRFYVGGVAVVGGGAGAAAIVPNGFGQASVAVLDLLSFLEASVLYTLTVSEIHKLPVEDIERRQLIVASVLVGNTATKRVLEPLIGRMAPYWGRKIVEKIPAASVTAVNKVLGRWVVTKYGTKQGLLVLGKQVPLAIGVGIGFVGNALFATTIVKTAKSVLGEPPKTWSDEEREELPAVPSKVAIAKKPAAAVKKPAAARQPAAKKPAARKPKPSA
jgi:hypothetical protein